MKVNEIIRKRRKELGLTLKDVATELGVSESLISRYESNDVKNMGIDKLIPLAKVLKCTPAFLMGAEDEPKPAPAVEDKKDPELERLIKEYNLTPEEQREYENISMTTATLMFNGRSATQKDKEELERVLKEFFVTALLKKRADEDAER